MSQDVTITLSEEFINAANAAEFFSGEELVSIGLSVKQGYEEDDKSRDAWKRRTEAAFDLALQVQKAKSFPWAGASNVKFPLVTIAALQWHARAYPLLIQGPEIVKMRVVGADPEGKLRQSADRVAKYMSYQLLEESDSWEEETDRALLQVPIVGCAFKKIYRNGSKQQNISELVPAKHFVVNYWAKSVDDAPRRTHVLPLTRNDIHTRWKTGLFRDPSGESWFDAGPSTSSGPDTSRRDKRLGQVRPARPDDVTPFHFLEQMVSLDLDGDGYEEPYIITVERESGWVARIVANFLPRDIVWDGAPFTSDIVRIEEDRFWVKIPFIPQPDGGVYDMGFGVLLGPLNESIDTIINQLIDAGTLQTTAGGFLARGVKIRGGQQSFSPFQWNRVDSIGEDLQKGIVPFPVREPSGTLFQLLGLLVDYTNRISGSTDIMVGENPGQNTPAETSRLMAEQGMKINSAIFKRVWRAFKQEFQLMYLLNRRHVPLSVTKYGESNGWISREDFQLPEESVRPAADPNLSSDGQRVQQASMVKQSAATTPGYDKDEVEMNWLRALRVENVERMFLGSKKVPPAPHPKVMLEQLRQEGGLKKVMAQMQARQQEKIMDIIASREQVQAEIELLKAQCVEILSAVGAAQAAHELKAFEAQIKVLQSVDESHRAYLELMLGAKKDGAKAPDAGGLPGMAAPSGNAGGPAGPGSPGQAGPGDMGAGGVPT
jgi:chaperonin GroES